MAPSSGGEQGDGGAGDGGGGAPERLAADRVGDDAGGEVGREDEGDDQRLERLVGPVEQHPGEDAAAVWVGRHGAPVAVSASV